MNQKRPKAALPTISLDSSLGYTLRRAQLSIYREFTIFMEELEIRPSEFAVLIVIQSSPGSTQAEVSETLGIQKANFVTLLDRLDDRGLTERRKGGGDRRSSALHLTRAGKVFVKRMEKLHNQFETQLMTRLGEKRSRQLLGLLLDFSQKGA